MTPTVTWVFYFECLGSSGSSCDPCIRVPSIVQAWCWSVEENLCPGGRPRRGVRTRSQRGESVRECVFTSTIYLSAAHSSILYQRLRSWHITLRRHMQRGRQGNGKAQLICVAGAVCHGAAGTIHNNPDTQRPMSASA